MFMSSRMSAQSILVRNLQACATFLHDHGTLPAGHLAFLDQLGVPASFEAVQARQVAELARLDAMSGRVDTLWRTS